MSETKNLKLFKHDEPLETNENQFNIKKALHDNWDKLDEFGGKVNTKTVEIENKQKQHDTDISNIKQEQQEQNLKIESNTTENKDNTELLNQIVGLLPSTKGEGENVTLDDTAEARFKHFHVQGNSKQETRTGKNKLPYPYKDLSSTVIQDLGDGRLILKGTVSQNVSIIIREWKIKAGKYKIVFNDTPIVNNSYFNLRKKPENEYYLQGVVKETTFEIPEDANVELSIVLAAGVYTYYPLNLMILEDTEKDKTFEQYGASPSPEFPSKIRNVGDNINLYSKDNANILNTMIDTQGLGVNAGDTYKTIYIPCKPNTTYTVSKLYDATKNRFALGFTDTEPTYSMKVEGYITNANVSDLTITTGANAKYLLAYIWITGGTTTYKEMLNSIKIEEGTQATAYSPYDCGNTEVIVCNKNLAVSDFEQYYNSPTAGYVLCPLKLKKGSTYKFTAKLTGVKMAGLVNYGIVRDGNSYEEFVNNASFVLDLSGEIFDEEFTIDDKFIAPKLVCWAKTEDIFNNLFKNYEIQLVEKTNTDSFVQHKQQTIVFPFIEGQKLYKGDYLAEDGIHHARKQIVLDGTENWEHDSMGGSETCVSYKYKINDYEGYEGTFAPTGKLMCNYLKEQKIYANEQEGITGGFGPYIFVKVKKSLLETPDFPGFKKWLAKRKDEGNPFVIEYPLMQEIIEPYTSEQQEACNKLKKLYSYNEQTNIFSTNEIGPIFNVEAIKNLNVAVLEQTTKES